MHDRAHDGEDESRGDVRIVRGLRLHSFRLGLSGVADVVEFSRIDQQIGKPFPVEYKHGRPKPDPCDEVQLCAQALCLEEMLETTIERGAIYYGKPRRRQEIAFTENLRRETEKLCEKLHHMVQAGITPEAVYKKECENCSLFDKCLPKVTGKKSHQVEKYLELMTGE